MRMAPDAEREGRKEQKGSQETISPESFAMRPAFGAAVLWKWAAGPVPVFSRMAIHRVTEGAPLGACSSSSSAAGPQAGERAHWDRD